MCKAVRGQGQAPASSDACVAWRNERGQGRKANRRLAVRAWQARTPLASIRHPRLRATPKQASGILLRSRPGRSESLHCPACQQPCELGNVVAILAFRQRRRGADKMVDRESNGPRDRARACEQAEMCGASSQRVLHAVCARAACGNGRICSASVRLHVSGNRFRSRR